MKPNLPDDDELSDSSYLNSYSKKEPFKAPDGYFDTLTSKIQDKIAADQKVVSSSAKALRPIYIIATILTLCISSGIFFFMIHNHETPPKEIACTYEDVIESGYYSELDENVLTEKLIASQPEKPSEDQAIEDYLINNSDETLLSN